MHARPDTGATETTAPTKPPSALDQASQLWGIEREFWDIWGKHHETPPETGKGVLKSLGVDTSSEPAIQRAISERLFREWSRPLRPTIVVGDSVPLQIVVRLPIDSSAPTACIEMRRENGMSERLDISLGDAPVLEEKEIAGRTFVEKQLRWPGKV